MVQPPLLLLIPDLFQQAAKSPTSRLYKFQEGIKKLTGFTTPVVWARGVFNYDFGLMPWRHEINTIGIIPRIFHFLIEVGQPIEVKKMDKASEEEVLRVQKLYIEELKRIWDEWKDVYATDRVSEFEIVE
jgi:2-acylglycerol O-acyltransferase 2